MLLACGAAAVWWWSRPAPAVPPMPAGIEEAEVRQGIEEARQRVVDSPASATAWGHLGLVLLAHRFDADADFCFTQAARLDPSDARWPYGSGLIVFKVDPARALPLLRQAASLAGSKYQVAFRLQLAEALEQSGNLDEADAIFGDVTALEPAHPRAALGRGQVALARGDAEAATPLLLLARSSRSAHKRATAQLAAAARARRDLQAAAAYDQEVGLLPEDPPWPDPFLDEMVRVQVGRKARDRTLAQLERQQDHAGAAEIYLRLIEEQPTPQAYIGAGTNLARAGDYPRGLALLQKAIELEDSANARTALAVTLFTRAEKENQNSPSSAKAREWFGEVIKHARRASELRADHGYAYLYWGLALKHVNEPAAAIEPLRKAVACQPATLLFQLSLGEALMEAGQTAEAEKYLENARAIDPNDPRLTKALERLQKAETHPKR
jgi:tetratricopeptide (TPR) repeat protein